MKNIIQKASALALAAFAVIGAYAQQRPVVTVSPVDIAPGEIKTVSVYVADDAADKFCNFQATVTLPAGFEFVNYVDERGNDIGYAQAGGRAAEEHFAAAPLVTKEGDVQSCKMGVVSFSNALFSTETDKSVIEFKIKAPATFDALSTIKLTDIAVSGIAKLHQGTAKSPYIANGLVRNSTLPQATFGFAEGDTLNLQIGQTATLTLNGTWPNTINVKAIEVHITLPEGLSYVKNSDDYAITFNDSRYVRTDSKSQSLINNDKNANLVIAAFRGTLAATPEAWGAITVKADEPFTGYKEVKATYNYSDKDGASVAQGVAKVYIGSVAESPKFTLSPDTVKIVEGDTADVNVAIDVPEGTKPTVKGAITLPEGLTFAEGDGTFNIEALDADTTVKVKVVAGKAFEGSKEITAVFNATGETGYAFDEVKDTIAVTVAAPKAPEFAFAEKDTLKLKEGDDAAIVVNLTIPEGTELSGITGRVTLPTGVAFSATAQGVELKDEDGDVNTNGNTAKFTVTKAENGVLLTINITGAPGFKDGDVKVEATATSKAGTVFDKVTINRVVINQTAATTGISSINANVEKQQNGARYNLAGQRVDESYKGVVIMNGKKFIAK